MEVEVFIQAFSPFLPCKCTLLPVGGRAYDNEEYFGDDALFLNSLQAFLFIVKYWDFILSNYLLSILVSEVSLYEREQAHQKPVVERHLVSLLNCLDRPHLQRYTFSHINQPPLLLVDLHSRNVPH